MLERVQSIICPADDRERARDIVEQHGVIGVYRDCPFCKINCPFFVVDVCICSRAENQRARVFRVEIQMLIDEMHLLLVRDLRLLYAADCHKRLAHETERLETFWTNQCGAFQEFYRLLKLALRQSCTRE